MSTAPIPYPYWRLSSFYFFYFAVLGALLPFWPLYLRDIGFSAAAIGVLAGIVQGTKVVAPSLWGWLADYTGARMRIIRGGALAALVVFAGVYVRQDFFWMALVIAGYSFFWNAVLAQFEVITLAHLRDDYPRYSLVRVGGSAGFIAAVAGLGWLFDHISVRWLPAIMLGLLAGILCASLAVRERAPEPRTRAARAPLRDILRRPVVLAFFTVCFLLQLAHGPYYTFFSVYLQDHGYDRTQIGLLWSLGVIAEGLLFIAMHRIFARVDLRFILLTSLALTVLRWLLTALWVEVLWVLLFAQCLHAASFASCHAVAIEFVRRSFAGGNEGQGMALYSGLCFGGGAAVGAVLSGLLWSFDPVLTFVGAALVSLLALAIAWRWIYAPPAPAL